MINNKQHDTMNVIRYPSLILGWTKSLVGACYSRPHFTQYNTRYVNVCKHTIPNRRSLSINCNKQHDLCWHTFRTLWTGSSESYLFHMTKNPPVNLLMILNMSITITVNTVQCSFPAVGISACLLSQYFHNILLFQNGRGNWLSSSPISINRKTPTILMVVNVCMRFGSQYLILSDACKHMTRVSFQKGPIYHGV